MEHKIVEVLKKIYDPEIPVNIYDLGLIYNLKVDRDEVEIDMTLTAPNCPIADYLVQEVHEKVNEVEGIGNVNINVVFEPRWEVKMMKEEARVELGLV